MSGGRRHEWSNDIRLYNRLFLIKCLRGLKECYQRVLEFAHIADLKIGIVEKISCSTEISAHIQYLITMVKLCTKKFQTPKYLKGIFSLVLVRKALESIVKYIF